MLTQRGETVSVAEGSAGGLISAALLAVPGASNYYVGGMVVYTLASRNALISDAVRVPEGMRGATEDWALYLAQGAAVVVGTTWGVGEGGAAGPKGNRYGDPSGHGWVAVAGPVERALQVGTGVDDRAANMFSFADAALDLLGEMIASAPPPA
ncbi:MAG: damage-inducible protein [Acidimicrobiia bacterium]|nr:damage-inducible protein [Acidimicrobiia bacterium]